MQTLKHDLNVLKSLVAFRIQSLTQKEKDLSLQKPNLSFSKPVAHQSPYDDFILQFRPGNEERLILLLALVPHLQPDFFESLIAGYFPQGADLPEFGGVKGQQHRGMMPTGETALFLLAGQDQAQRMALMKLFDDKGLFATEGVLELEQAQAGEPRMSGRILLAEEYADYFLTGKPGKPRPGPDFPAKCIQTQMEWNDLVLPQATMSRIKDIMSWMQYNPLLIEKDQQLARRLKPGYRALFYGPSGTGKTLTATLLGKRFEKDVYRIDLSQVVSKYIGETEKNLEKVFTRAEHKDWILFFDEADALFGKRSSIQSAHDKYANQETAYLLQRIEDYPGLIILASNFKNNLDTAFARRFNMMVYFPVPGPEDRLLLWKKSLPGILHAGFNCHDLAGKYEITGAAILHAIHFAAIRSMAKKRHEIKLEDITEGIRHELQKEGKFI